MKGRIIAIAFIFCLGVVSLPSCNHYTCPTYATSGPSKVKKKKKKSGIAAGNTKKVKKLDKGKPMSGL